MTHKERIFHSVLFEIFAILLLLFLATFVSDKPAASLTGLAIAISALAVVWNYFFNIGFDRVFGVERHLRSVKIRLLHTLSFEAGLVIATLPLMMWVLEVDFITALVMDIGAIVIFALYALVFNWLYDHLRLKVVTQA